VEATVVEILAKFRAEVGDFNRRVGEVEASLTKLQKTADQTRSQISNSFAKMESAFDGAVRGMATAAAVGGTALIAMGMKAFNAAADVEELNTVLDIMEGTTGQAPGYLHEVTKAVADMGIEMDSAQRLVVKFAKNQLDLSQAADIARAAQDLAVVSQANSTDTANRLTHAILSLNSQALRSAGIQTSVGQAVRAYAVEVGKTAQQLTQAEKQQAVMNAIIKEGAKISGVYEASMTNVGKVLRSFPRITKELQVSFGQALIKPLGPLILKIYDLYKNISLLFIEGGKLRPIIDALGAVFIKLTEPFMKIVDGAIEMVKNMKPLTTSVGDLGGMIQKYLPAVGALGAGLAVLGGRNLLRGVPIFGQLFGAMNPILIAFTALVALSPKIQSAFMNFASAASPVIGAFAVFFDTLVSIVNILIDGLAGALNKAAGWMRALTSAVGDSSTAIDILTSVAIAVAIVSIGLMVKKIAQLVVAKAVLYAEVILVVGAIALFVYALYKAWNSSERFRKMLLDTADVWLGFAEAIIWGSGKIVETFSLLARGFANVSILVAKLRGDTEGVKIGESILKGIDKLNGGFDTALETVNNFRYKFKNMKDDINKPIKWEDILGKADKFIPNIEEIKKKITGIFSGDTTDTGTDAGKGLGKNAKNSLREALQAYNTFITYEFVPGFTKDSETARRTIERSLDLVKKVFDDKAKGLQGKALKQLEKAYWSLDASVRKFIPQAQELGDAFEALNKALAEAQKDLENAIKERQSAIDDLGALLRRPFGEPSDIEKGMSSANATVDSMIAMYDRLVDVVNRRFTKIEDSGRKNALLDFLGMMTESLIRLAGERDKALKVWEKSNQELERLIAEQADFGKQLVSVTRGYATQLFDVAKGVEMTTVQAIKTATGTVITQIKKSSGGLDGLQKQLSDRLKQVKGFTENIRSLIGKGLNRDYIRQLLEAGPEAAGGLAELLTTAGQDQISSINSLYSEIGSLTESFGGEMAGFMYDNQIKSQQAIVDANAASLTAIQAAMDATRKAIEDRMTPLTDFMAQLGKDMAQALIDELKEKETELVALATAIGNAIASALASAMAGLGIDPSKISMPPNTQNPIVNPYTNRDSAYDRNNNFGDTSVIVNNYNPTGALESGTITARALERVLSKRRSLE
jgi:hypothetical protein